MTLAPALYTGIYDNVSVLYTTDFPFTPYTLFFIDKFPSVAAKAVLDFGTGNGIFSLLAAKHLAKKIIAVDIRQESQLLLAKNIKKNNFNNITWWNGLSDSQAESLMNSIDIVLCNPSSIPVKDSNMPAYLDGGEFGNRMIFEMIAIAAKVLKPGGELYFLHTSLVSRSGTNEELESRGFKYEIIEEREFSFREVYSNALNTIFENKKQFPDIVIVEREGQLYEKVFFYKTWKAI